METTKLMEILKENNKGVYNKVNEILKSHLGRRNHELSQLRIASKLIENEINSIKNALKFDANEKAVAEKRTYLIKDLSNELKKCHIDLSQFKIYDYLRKNNYLYSSGDLKNMPTKSSEKEELFVKVRKCGRMRAELTKKGFEFFKQEFIRKEKNDKKIMKNFLASEKSRIEKIENTQSI